MLNVGTGLSFLTVNTAALLLAFPQLFVKLARYCLPLSLVVSDGMVNVELVAPEILVKLVPLFVLTCHCTVGAGVPLAVAIKVAVPPTATVCASGCLVIAGGVFTLSVAAFDVIELLPLATVTV